MPTKYDQVLYPTSPRKEAHPERLATIAHLAGLETAPLGACRVLELGCGDGGNVIPIAWDYPGSRFVGVDLAELPLAAARKFSEQLGLSNIEFQQGDLTTWSAPGSEFDYILVHGVFSWVPPAVRAGILRICQQHLAPQGVAFISYNSLPGCYFRKFIWDMLRFHTRGIDDPEEKVASAREFAEKAIGALDDKGHPGVIRSELKELLERHESVVFHDDLAGINEPFYVEEFTALAQQHGLQYLGDADPVREHGLPYQVSTEDRGKERQYADFATARRFRETLLCREGLALAPSIELPRLLNLWVSSKAAPAPEQEDGTQTFTLAQDRSLSTNHPVAKALLLAAGKAWPEMIRANSLPLPGLDPAADLDCVVRLMMTGALEFRLEPPHVNGVSARPCASGLVRAQLALGKHDVTSQRHCFVNLGDEMARRLVALLDGTRDHTEIAAALVECMDSPNLREGLPEKLETSLRMLANLSLLTA
ncbi:MAG: class I SAM-dependent methyltransferase [Bryobacterales bacterium]|nr:class I SAM-dependent methyltransferase [Bryobacterales bacterium]